MVLHEVFNLIFGTSTGSIIGSLLAIGKTVDEIHGLYRRHVPSVMSPTNRKERSARLALLSKEVFKEVGFDAVKTGIGIVATKWVEETPLIFKADPQQAHGSKASFVPGFGVPLGEAVQASCSAFPLFDKKVVALPDGDTVALIDGGFCANNPTLYAIADAVRAFEVPRERIRVLNIGVGDYPPRPVKKFTMAWCLSFFEEAEITQKTFNINTHSMEELRRVLFGDIQTVRVSEAFTHPSMMTDFLEHDLDKLNLIHRRGRESFGKQESGIMTLLV